jgi:hypothetical protein
MGSAKTDTIKIVPATEEPLQGAAIFMNDFISLA